MAMVSKMLDKVRRIFDLGDEPGKYNNSKVLSFIVSFTVLAFIPLGFIDTDAETWVLLGLIAAAFGNDGVKSGLKTYIQSKNGNGKHDPSDTS